MDIFYYQSGEKSGNSHGILIHVLGMNPEFLKLECNICSPIFFQVSSHYLKGKGMTKFTEDYLLWHYFGKSDQQQHSDLITVVRDHLHRIKHTRNLALFIDSFVKRSAITINRPVVGSRQESAYPNSLLICGNQSPFLDDTVDLNSKLDPRVTQWIKVSDATGMVLDEQPTVVLNALILFLQGLGHGMLVILLDPIK